MYIIENTAEIIIEYRSKVIIGFVSDDDTPVVVAKTNTKTNPIPKK